jgi:endogenous inhibitor of DNA gyrase (YacG/DUF329 family)
MVDLGTWAGEHYRVPGGPIDDHEHPEDNAHPAERPSDRETMRSGESKKLLH